MPTTATPKHQRRDTILGLVRARRIRSQAELQELLEAQGFEVNQATLSRDLRDMGLRKGPDGYELPGHGQQPAGAPGTPGLQLLQAVREWLLSAVAAGHLLVLKTPPSGASPLALALDQASGRGILGTIAGDDTVLVITKSPTTAKRLTKELLGLKEPS